MTIEQAYKTNGIRGFFEKEFLLRKNIFLTKDYVDKLINIFYIKYRKTIRIKNILFKWKSKCRNHSNPVNKIFLDLSSDHRDKDILIINDPKSLKKYKFSLLELSNIISYALMTTEETFIITPQYPKNPYTNSIFTTGQLIHIYNIMIKRSFKIPLIIHKWRECYFDLELFSYKYSEYLIDKSVDFYIREMSDEDFKNELILCLKNYREKICLLCSLKLSNLKNIFGYLLKKYLIYEQQIYECTLYVREEDLDNIIKHILRTLPLLDLNNCSNHSQMVSSDIF